MTKDATLVFLGRLRGGGPCLGRLCRSAETPAEEFEVETDIGHLCRTTEAPAEEKGVEADGGVPIVSFELDEQGCDTMDTNVVAQRHAKLCMDASGLIRKGAFGGIALFDGTLEDQVGHMDASALRAIYAEHVLSANAKTPFSPTNNPGLQCTPEGELLYVVGTDGIDTEKGELKLDASPAHYAGCMVEGRNDKSVSKLMEAEEARRAGLRVEEVVALRLYSGTFLHATEAS